MANELISEYVDLDATEKQTKALIDQLERVESKYARLAGIKIDLSGSVGGAAVTTKMKQAAEATQELSTETIALIAAAKERQKIDASLVATSVKIAAADTQEAKALTILKKELQAVNAEQKNAARENLSAEGSLEQLRATLIRLQKEYDNLSKVDREAETGVKLRNNIKGISDQLKKLEGDTGRFQRNVGNYSGAVEILEDSLNKVNGRLKENAQTNKLSANAVEALAKEQQLLQQFIEAQTQGFKNANQEIKENTVQLQQLAAAGLEGTEAYQKLFAATSDLKDETADLKKALTNAAPDDVAFNAAADAARGLVGVYGLAQSAAAVFGEDNEVLAETMVKLQAAETALQSIEAIRAVFKKENAVFQAKELVMGKILIAQTALQGATESKNIVVRYAAIAAQKALNAVTSVGAGPIIAIIAALAILIPLIANASEGNEKMAKSLDKVNAELEESVKLLDSYVDSVAKSGEERIAKMEASFEREKDIRKAQVDILYDQQRETRTALTLMRYDYEDALNKIEKLAKKSLKTELSDKEKESIEKLQKVIDTRLALRKREEDISSKIEVTIQNNRKADIEDNIKAQQLNIEIEQKGLETRNKLLQESVGNEEKTYAERIQAANDFYATQRRIIELEAKKALLTPGQTPQEIRKIEADKTAALKEAQRTRSNTITEFQKEEAARIKAAQYELLSAEITARAEANAAIADNENESISDRSDALAGELQQRIALVKATLANELSLRKGILKDERVSLEAKSNQEIINLRNNFNLRLLALQNAALAADEANNQASTNRRRDELLAQLADEYNTRQLTAEQYEQKKFDVESRYAKASIQLLIESTRKQIELSGISYEAKKGLLEKLAAYERELAEKTAADNDAKAQTDFQKRTTLVQNFAKLSADVGNVISELSAIGYEREVAAIESAINALEKKKALDIEVATRSIANEQDRAAAITTIEARAAAEREALERRRRQIESQRAKTERLLTVGRIIADTAAAVVAALGTKPFSPINYALAAAAGALGAAQVAKVLATPLPQFKHGKNADNDYEGLAIVGDGGKRELHIREDGTREITPAVPTLTYVKRNDIILPDADKALRDFTGGRTRVPKTGEATTNNAGVIQAIEKGNQRMAELAQVVKNKDSVNVDISYLGILAWHKYGNDNLKYIQEQTNWP
jgi:hypothetical protein